MYDIPLAYLMDKNLENEVRWSLETLDPNVEFRTLKRECDWAASILNPETQLDTLDVIAVHKGLQNAKARQKAVEDACVIACNAMRFFLKKEAIISELLVAEVGAKRADEILETVNHIAMLELKKGAKNDE